MLNLKKSNFIGTLLLFGACTMMAWPVLAEDTPQSLFTEGDVFGQIRYRMEMVDQAGPASINEDATAHTLRTNLGFKTGKYKDFQGLVEAQFVQHLGAEAFNDTVNVKTRYPVVADPDNQEINQAWISWTGLKSADIKLGRQALNLDNQRFIGSVDWRQNDQTFDAALGSYTDASKKLQLRYGYVWNVNRIFGDDHPLGDLKSENHILHGSYQFSGWLNATAYGYWLDFNRMPANSSRTMGLRATGQGLIAEELNFNYEAEYAWQQDHASNPLPYKEDYRHLAVGLSYKGAKAGLGQEFLGGDGTAAFQAPLATLHKFNGWADKFLVTPATGLEDSYATLGYKFGAGNEWLAKTELTITYHDFRGDSGGDYGHEWNASASRDFDLPKGIFFDKAVATLKYADYTAKDAPYTDAQKVWLQLGLTF